MNDREPELRLLKSDRAAARSLSAERARHCSRSYRQPWALMAWYERRVGVDIERVGPADRAFARSICTPDELRCFDRELDDAEFIAVLWSGKEALAKALGDAVDYDPRRLPSPLSWALDVDSRGPAAGAPLQTLRAGAWRARLLGAERLPAGHVGWVVWSV